VKIPGVASSLNPTAKAVIVVARAGRHGHRDWSHCDPQHQVIWLRCLPEVPLRTRYVAQSRNVQRLAVPVAPSYQGSNPSTRDRAQRSTPNNSHSARNQHGEPGAPTGIRPLPIGHAPHRCPWPPPYQRLQSVHPRQRPQPTESAQSDRRGAGPSGQPQSGRGVRRRPLRPPPPVSPAPPVATSSPDPD
jgi:hypothetical protein